MPSTQGVIGSFIAHLYEIGHAHSTILTYMSAISAYHKLRGFDDPCKNYFISRLLSGVKKLKPDIKSLKPINKDLLHGMIDVLRWAVEAPYDRLMYKTVMLFMYYGCFRVGEILVTGNMANHTLRRENIELIIANGQVQSLLLTLTSYKHHQGKSCQLKLAKGRIQEYCPVDMFIQYVRHCTGKLGYVFRKLDGSPVDRSDLVRVLKLCLDLLGIENSRYNCHSFRIGRTTDLALVGVPAEKIKLIGRWSSDAYQKYIKPAFVLLPPS